MPLEYNDPRLKYVTAYLNKHYPEVLCDDETEERYIADSSLIDVYMKEYENILECLPDGFTKSRFDEEIYIQKSLNTLGLDGEAFWGFLVFIFHVYRKYSILHTLTSSEVSTPRISIDEELQKLGNFLIDYNAPKKENTKILIKKGRGKKSVEISDRTMLKEIIRLFTSMGNHPEDYPKPLPAIFPKLQQLGREILNGDQNIDQNTKVVFIKGRKLIEVTNPMVLLEIASAFMAKHGVKTWHNRLMVHSCAFNMSLRALKYCILKTIYDEIVCRPEGVHFTNNEKIFYLAVSNICGFKHIDVTLANGVHISQLFDNYKDYNIHISSFDLLFDTRTDRDFMKDMS